MDTTGLLLPFTQYTDHRNLLNIAHTEMLLPQASGEVSLGPARTSGDLELSIGASGEISGTLATTWGMEGEVASSDCFIAGVGRVGKSQGRGTCGIQIVSKTIQITKKLQRYQGYRHDPNNKRRVFVKESPNTESELTYQVAAHTTPSPLSCPLIASNSNSTY